MEDVVQVNLTEKEGESCIYNYIIFPFLHFFNLIGAKITILNPKKI